MQSTENTGTAPQRRVLDLSTNGNRKAFSETLASVNIGDRIIYHVGLYASGPHKQAAAIAYEQGLVMLFQSRSSSRGEQRFCYIAQRTTPEEQKK